MKTVFAYMCFALLIPGVSMAAPEFSISIGKTHSTADTLSPGGLSSTLKDDFSGTGKRLSVGIALQNWLAFEGAWAELGTNSGTVEFSLPCVGVCPPGLPTSTTQAIKQDGSAYWVSYAPYFEYRHWRFSGALGVVKSNIRTVHVGTPVVQESRESGLLIGAGAAYYFSEHFGVRFDAEKLGSEASQVSTSLTFRF